MLVYHFDKTEISGWDWCKFEDKKSKEKLNFETYMQF